MRVSLAVCAALICSLAVISSAHSHGDNNRPADTHTVFDGVEIAHDLAGGVKTMSVVQGENIRLVLSTNAPQELHLHGYDLIAQSGHNKPAIFTFRADHAGRFAIVSHVSEDLLGRKEKTLAYIEVKPE